MQYDNNTSYTVAVRLFVQVLYIWHDATRPNTSHHRSAWVVGFVETKKNMKKYKNKKKYRTKMNREKEPCQHILHIGV